MIYLPIQKDFLPEEFEIQLGEEQFIMTVNYNELFDFFTIDLYDPDKNPIILGEKMIINQPLWSGISDSRLPAPTLVPLDPSGKTSRITFENFMVTTFLTIDAEVIDNGSA